MGGWDGIVGAGEKLAGFLGESGVGARVEGGFSKFGERDEQKRGEV